jgi:hypothetical protein
MSWFCFGIISLFSSFCLPLFLPTRSTSLHRIIYMDKIRSNDVTALDGRLCMASIAGVYSPLILTTAAASILF